MSNSNSGTASGAGVNSGTDNIIDDDFQWGIRNSTFPMMMFVR
jgi:hypothetical protein